MNSQSEYEEFFESEIFIHYEYLQKFLFTATEDHSLAGDILQETMARAWEKIELVKEYSNIKHALRIIARNILYNHYKKKCVREELPFNREIEEVAHTKKDNLMHVLKNEDRRMVLDAVGKLKKPYMQVILLRYYYDQSFKDVAKLTSTNYNTVLSHHRRAIKLLKEIFGHRS